MAKYGPRAHEAVEREMKEMKEGKLKTGTGKKVTNPKQAIAIGLSEARREGGKVPPDPNRTKSNAQKSTTAKKTSSMEKSASKKSSASEKKSGSGKAKK